MVENVAFFSAGYLIIKKHERPDCMDRDILPDKIISSSNCITDSYPHAWGFSTSWKPSSPVATFTTVAYGEESPSEDKNLKNVMEELNLDKKDFRKLQKWVEKKYKTGHFEFPNFFLDLQTAREFYNKYLQHIPDLELIGMGFANKHIDKFINDKKQEQIVQEAISRMLKEHPEYIAITEERYNKYLPDEDTFEIEKDNFLTMLLRYEPIDPNGTPIGFEVIGYEVCGSFHSYICNGLEKDLKNELDVKFNENGLIDLLEDADRATDYIEEGEMGEPVDWYPCIIIKYDF